MPDLNKSNEFPLADLIHALSEQLRRSESRASELISSAGQPLIAWTSAQIEVGVTWTRDVNGEIDIRVLRLGGQRTKENTATMTVTLKPEPAGGGSNAVDGPPTSAIQPLTLELPPQV